METCFRFSKTALTAIACPPDKSKVRVRDTDVPALSMLVTANGSEFARVPGLAWEDWTA